MIAASLSSRNLVAALMVASTLAPSSLGRPVDRANDAPPLTRSVGMVSQAAFDSRSDMRADAILQATVFDRDSLALKRALQPPNTNEMDERGLIDTLTGILHPIGSLVPGYVQLEDLLLGDSGLLKGLAGMLLVEPDESSPPAGSADGGDANNSTDPAVEAAKQSQRFSLMASKKQRTQVFLMPVHQANVATDSNNDTATANNDTMTVKMMVHMLDKTGAPIVMCTTYGATPPSDLGMDACSGDTDASASSNGTSTDSSMQLFTYTKSSGALKPMFKKAADEPAADATPAPPADGSSNSTDSAAAKGATTEMRMHFIFAASPDAATSTDDTDADTSASATPAPTAAVAPSDAAPAAAAPADQANRRITLGRQFVVNPSMKGMQRNASFHTWAEKSRLADKTTDCPEDSSATPTSNQANAQEDDPSTTTHDCDSAATPSAEATPA